MESPESVSREKRSFLPPRVEILRLDFSHLGRPVRPQPMEDRGLECGRVVNRLLAIVREHRMSARRVGSPLDDGTIHAILDALRVESLGGDPRFLLRHPDPVASWLRESLYQELLEEPGNVLFTTRIDDKTVRYEAMEPSFWRECLAGLKERLSGA